ncbi:MAG: arginine deiminase family protein [Planctomycetota bacterium]
MLIAITRGISPRFNQCELTLIDRTPIDIDLACAQHRQYELALERLGVRVEHLPAEIDMPDSVFVEDAAVVLDEVAIITRPGAASRRAETESIEKALSRYRKIVRIEAPGTIDGGDVLCLEKTVYVGLSTRSNSNAIEQLRSALGPYRYRVEGVPIKYCLHLKSALTRASKDTLLCNPAWVDRGRFRSWRFVEVAPEEPAAANIVHLPASAIFPSHYPRTQERLERAGVTLTLVDATEVAKAEGAVTCCSLIFTAGRP